MHLIGAICSLVFWSSFGIYITKVDQRNRIKTFIFKIAKHKRNLTYFYFKFWNNRYFNNIYTAFFNINY
ncbi:hypothetical protein [Mycoplasma sp. 'Moose RK']|uniref:hypothetical protein n=1 Tax=Mycoplasma sp. 'Moose RK' TaxID=2780095 RepID=UPI0018C28023|nr:hypothetical protein [Mycoplasma sp. 'Moose RK']MBG0730761.1 hypothetical protein [Mycoplasma sp. 'Moose RK']